MYIGEKETYTQYKYTIVTIRWNRTIIPLHVKSLFRENKNMYINLYT